MKKKEIYLLCGLFVIGQMIIPYQAITLNSAIAKKEQEIIKETEIQKQGNSELYSKAEVVTYRYKKKKKSMSHIEKNISTLQKAIIGTGKSKFESGFGDVVSVLTGKLLIGSPNSKGDSLK